VKAHTEKEKFSFLGLAKNWEILANEFQSEAINDSVAPITATRKQKLSAAINRLRILIFPWLNRL
jgi:hypothetical protein